MKARCELEPMMKYFKDLGRCYFCNSKIAFEDMTSNDNDEVLMRCNQCLSTTIDGTELTKQYIRKFGSYIEEYGYTLKDGFPTINYGVYVK